MRPSKLIATFAVTCGRPRVTRVKKGAWSALASASKTPSVTSTPASTKRRSPRPDTFSKGSTKAATTRAKPASTHASAHGGVRPVWLQGSKVT
jgi:hypothetical protein